MVVVKLGHIRVLLHHGNEFPDVGFLLLLLVVTGQLAGNIAFRALWSRVNFKMQTTCSNYGRWFAFRIFQSGFTFVEIF